MSAVAPPRPYKYLDFYDLDDYVIYFGRRREIEQLLADIVTTRLVVLFARSGTGKSSLINAGVRPRLRDRNYRTIVTRVGTDPVSSLRQASQSRQAADVKIVSPSLSLAEVLTDAVKTEKRPLVVFFDQFEEFFLNDIPKDVQRAFIADVGKLYRTADAGVHLVFSMREDYIAELDAFRDEIPTIFEKESQLRLRLLTDEQAKEGIEGPSRVFEPQFVFEKGLVERIVADLPREQGLIQPVAVQIVCDSLWEKGPAITSTLYEAMGKAAGIIETRVAQDLAQYLTADHVLLLERSLDLMHTKDWTKRPVSESELRSKTGADSKQMSEFMSALIRTGLFRMESRGSDSRIEWMSDYVSELSRELTPKLRLIWLRKVHEADSPISVERTSALLDDDALRPLLKQIDWYLLLRAGAASRDTLGQWKRAVPDDPWPYIEDALNDHSVPEDHAARLIQFLGEETGGPAVKLLAAQLRKPSRTRTALRALGAVRDPAAVKAIQPFLDMEEWQIAALDALRTIGTPDAIKLADGVQKRGKSIGEILSLSKTPDLQGMDEEAWSQLADIREFAGLIGPSISGDAMLERMQKIFEYPFSDTTDVRTVFEYLNVTFGPGWQKVLLEQAELTETYDALATLPLGRWLTTDYTNALEDALARHGRNADVVHLLGEWTVEDSRNELLMDRVPRAMASIGHPSKFIVFGYARDDPEWSLIRKRAAAYVIASPPQLANRRQLGRAREFFEHYARTRNVRFYWGTPEQFVKEFHERFTKT